MSNRIPFVRLSWVLLSFLLSWLGATRTLANPIEITFEGSYSRQRYDATSFTWTRRYSAAIGYTLFNQTEIEISYQKIDSQTVFGSFQNVSYFDQVYSLDVVQGFLPQSSFFQPFVRLGLGQLNRNAQGFFSNGTAPPAITDSITGVIGLGGKIYLSRRFAIRLQATSYLAGGDIASWQQNLSFNAGLSVIF